MANFNRVMLMGRLTRDVDLRYVGANNTAVTDIGLAVSDKRKNAQGEWVEETTFVDVTMWGRTAEVASEYLSKGATVFIEGRLKLDSWEQEGQKRSKLRVVCERMQMLPKGTGGGGSGGGGGGGGRAPRQHDDNEYSEPTDDFSEPAHSAASAPAPKNQEGDIPF